MNLRAKNYSHIHFIAHSVSAKLIDFATVWLRYWVTKEGRPALAIHETFLDAYDPVSDPTRYGRQADWVDNYVDTRDVADLFLGFDGTKLFLQNGYDIDVTPIKPALSVDSCLAFSPTLLDVWRCRHKRPFRFYGLSIDPSYVGNIFSASYDPIQANSTGGMGYPLSLENGHSMSLLNNLYQKGEKCVMDGGICYAGAVPPSVWTFIPAAVAGTVVDSVTGLASYAAGTGVTLFRSIKLGVISLLADSAASVGRTAGDHPFEPLLRGPSALVNSEFDPSQHYYIVKLDVDPKINARSLKIEGKETAFSESAGIRPASHWLLDYTSNEDEEGVWRITPKADLEAGEYGIFDGMRLFGFGVGPASTK